jgi:hypothetical protein
MDTSRTDIHKGAISLEQVAACFHELASVADAIVVAQRKLSRALKDCAGLKGCPEIASTSLGDSDYPELTGLQEKPLHRAHG